MDRVEVMDMKEVYIYGIPVPRKDISAGVTIDGPVCVDLAFYFERPKSHLNGSGSLRKGYSSSHIVKPDLDKLVRAILDSGTVGLVWRDDAQVVRLTATKNYVQESGAEALPGVRVKVWKEEAND